MESSSGKKILPFRRKGEPTKPVESLREQLIRELVQATQQNERVSLRWTLAHKLITYQLANEVGADLLRSRRDVQQCMAVKDGVLAREDLGEDEWGIICATVFDLEEDPIGEQYLRRIEDNRKHIARHTQAEVDRARAYEAQITHYLDLHRSAVAAGARPDKQRRYLADKDRIVQRASRGFSHIVNH